MCIVSNNIILIAGEALNYCYGKCPNDKNICNVSCLKQLGYPKGGFCSDTGLCCCYMW